jgi:hypothetical protein
MEKQSVGQEHGLSKVHHEPIQLLQGSHVGLDALWLCCLSALFHFHLHSFLLLPLAPSTTASNPATATATPDTQTAHFQNKTCCSTVLK